MHCEFTWMDEKVTPTTYELVELVRLARRARSRGVRFDWDLDSEELVALRRAIREWITKETGRFRAFDERMLAALDTALGEREPPTGHALEDEIGSVILAEHAGTYRVTGTTTFDVVFGYANTGVTLTMPGAIHLTEAMRSELVRGFTTLGWDVGTLAQGQYKSVRNAVYGLALGYGAENVPPRGEAVVLDVLFEGPFALLDDLDIPCLFAEPVANRAGVYLWTVRSGDGFRPWYVGQTQRSFAQRTAEHVRAYLSGQYEAYEVASIADGSFHRIPGPPAGQSPSTLPAFVRALPERLPQLLELLRETRIFVAPLAVDDHLLDRVEGALGRHYKQTKDLSNYLEPGLKLPDAIPGDRPLSLRLAASHPILGLPTELREPA